MKLLDVPSGGKLPVYKGEILHANISRIPNVDILCDISNMPFRQESFDMIFSCHILEHLGNPEMAVKELKRVSRNIVVIKVPNAMFYRFGGEGTDHIYSWTEFTLANLLRKTFKHVEIQKSFRITPYDSRIKRAVDRIKLVLLALFTHEVNELTAICR